MSNLIPKASTTGKVYLVGAGPGDPELLTLRALRLLASADYVLHDALVSTEVLAMVSPGAVLENVGKRCGQQQMRQENIHARMIELALAGLSLVRLQGGDPTVFGRAGEEISALARAGVDWEIVPGITAASAAAAAAGISLTDRRTAGQLVFLAGHKVCLRPDDASRAVSIPAPDGVTVAIYMPSCSYAQIAARFLHSGWRGDTPCIICSQVSSSRQQIVRSTIESIARYERLPSPAILIVGETTSARRLLSRDMALELSSQVKLSAAG
jgi:uroporphyrin-III C-methyltransferase